MKFNEVKRAKAYKAWEMAQALCEITDDIDTFNNYEDLSEEENNMVIFLVATRDDAMWIFDGEARHLFSEIVGLADNMVFSSVDKQLKIMLGFMGVVQ